MASVDPVPITQGPAERDVTPPVAPAERHDDGTGSSGLTGFQLTRRLAGDVWLGQTDVGEQVAARWLTHAPGASSPIVAGRVAALAALDTPTLVPVLGVAIRQRSVWLLSELAAGPTLRRLSDLAGLTCRQVALIGSDILAGLDELHTRGLVHGRLRSDNVIVGPDGRVRLCDWALATLQPVELPRQRVPPESGRLAVENVDLTAARHLLSDLVSEVRGRPPRGGPATKDVAAAIEEGPDLDALRAALDGWWSGDVLGDRTREELGTLVAAVQQPPVVQRRSSDPPTPLRVAAAAPSPQARGKDVRRPALSAVGALWKPLAALSALVLIVGVEAAMFGDQIVRDIQTLRAPASSSASATAAPSAARLPVLGVRSAGRVSRVDARPVRSCAPGKPCDVQITVQVRPRRTASSLRWQALAVDLCTDKARVVGSGSVRVPARADHVMTTQRLSLPAAKALAVGVVTGGTDRAASPAFPAPAGQISC